MPLPLPLDVAQQVVEMLVATGRAAPAARWVDHLKAKARAERAANLPHNRL